MDSLRLYVVNHEQTKRTFVPFLVMKMIFRNIYGEFDPGSERTLAACLIHASLTRKSDFGWASKVANG